MAATAPQHDEHGSALEPPRFSLRSLLMAMTVLSCLFAVLAAVGIIWSAMILFFSSLVFAHVLGNTLGTKLRDGTSQSAARGGRRPLGYDIRPVPLAIPHQLTLHTRLRRITLVMTIGGSLAGGALGGSGSAALYPEAGVAAVCLGVVSSAVLGAFAGFAFSSFLSVARQALGEALQEGDSPTPRHASHGPS